MAAAVPLGLSWAAYVDSLVEDRGALAQVAQHVAARRDFTESPESIERALRRLRERQGDGGVWGPRLLRIFGLPAAVEDRIRWMGHYHSRFTDLPVSICEELLRPWDRPPVSETPARTWLLLGRTNLALRRAEDATALLAQVRLCEVQAPLEARIERRLVEAYAVNRDEPERVDPLLIECEQLLEEAPPSADTACLFARLVDQKAYRFNRPREGQPDHSAAEALYEQIPVDGPPFARCRRENGLGWSRLELGQRDAAACHARASLQAAGDAGSLRMRAMALNLLAAATSGLESETAQKRARAIAVRSEDEALRLRFARQKR